MKNPDKTSTNNLYCIISFEQASDGEPSKLFILNTPVIKDGATNARWELSGMPHFETSSDNLIRKPLSITLYDKGTIFADKMIGTTKISVNKLLKGYGKKMTLQFNLLGSPGTKIVATGGISLYIAEPFNWLTCGLHEPDCFQTTFHPENLLNCDNPSCVNCGGFFSHKTCGQCHLPSGEKLCACHAPDCLDQDRVSVINCFGLLYPPTYGKCAALDEGCGEIGLCAISCRCCGNECRAFECLRDGCQEFDDEIRHPISFERAKVIMSDVKILALDSASHIQELHESASKHGSPASARTWIVDEHPGLLKSQLGKSMYFNLSMGDKCRFVSEVSTTGSWKADLAPVMSFEASSDEIYNGQISFELWEKHNVNLTNVLLGTGKNGRGFVDLLKVGYNSPIETIINIRKIVKTEDGLDVFHLAGKLEVKLMLREVKAFSVKDLSGKKHRESILYEIVPDKKKLNVDQFVVRAELHLPKSEADDIIFQSITDIDKIVGYQVELFSKSTGRSKGIWVIGGVKKFRFSSTSYLLTNVEGFEKWYVLKKEGQTTMVAGKPFILKRRVFNI